MLVEFAAVLAPLSSESCSRSDNLSEEQVRASEKPPGPGQAFGGGTLCTPELSR